MNNTNNIGDEEVLGAFQPTREFPVDEDAMMETIENEIGYVLTGQADTIARNFYYDMEKAAWKIKGRTVIDWLKVLSARIERQTGENILSGYENEDIIFWFKTMSGEKRKNSAKKKKAIGRKPAPMLDLKESENNWKRVLTF